MTEKDKKKATEEKPKKDKSKPEGVPAKGASEKKREGKGAKSKETDAAPFQAGAGGNGPVRSGPPRLRLLYEKEITQRLMKEFGYKNRMQVPKIVKITLNMGLGDALTNPRVLDSATEELAAISGQKPVITKAKKSIATFKLRQGQKIGCMVTLRRERMYEFLDRLVNFALPRVRDFKGVSSRAFDGRGNFSLGIREQIIFPEINYDKIDKIKGMNISIVTTAKTDEEGRALLRYLGMPFRS
jgi:large subunit ribosomal protein L5